MQELTSNHHLELRPKARAICLECLKSPSGQLRVKAVKGLAYVYDPSVGGTLARRLATEEPWVQGEIIRTIGKARDKGRVDALTKLVRQPTLVATKLAWIEAMMALAPNRAAPILKKWADSPSAELAAAARKALARVRNQQDEGERR